MIEQHYIQNIRKLRIPKVIFFLFECHLNHENFVSLKSINLSPVTLYVGRRYLLDLSVINVSHLAVIVAFRV